jgi:hypothetical protein
MVPDTYDVEERIAYAANGLTGPTDPEADYELYWKAGFLSNPPVMTHDWNDHVQSKFLEALPLMRIASGSDTGMHAEKAWMRALVKMQGPDGLLYHPLKGRPWADDGIFAGMGEASKQKQYATVFFNGRILGAIAIYELRAGGGFWKRIGERIVKGLRTITVDRGDHAYFTDFHVYPGSRPKAKGPPRPFQCAHHAWAVMGLAQFARHMKYEPAYELSGKFARMIMKRSRYFNEDGTWPNPNIESDGSLPTKKRPENIIEAIRWHHFHEHTYNLLALLEYALLARDREMIQFVKNGYEDARLKGEPLIGFYPEWLNLISHQTAESCQIADMIALALKLSAAGAGDYWDDADRAIRNQFAENQLIHYDWAYRVSERLPLSQYDPLKQSVDRVPERNVGAFATFPTPNDWWETDASWAISHCCTGNATRTLYYIWEHILDHERGMLTVHLPLNRSSKWADVHSHLPYRGQVDVAMKRNLKDLSIRLAEWVKPARAHCAVNGRKRRLAFEGRYAKVGTLKKGDTVELSFPIGESIYHQSIEKRVYKFTRRGNDVVAVWPRGINCPFYQRDRYREGVTRWRKMRRFLSSETIDW